MTDYVKRLFVVKQIALVLWVFLCDDSTIEDMSYCAPARSKTCLFFCQQFPSLGLELIEDNLERDLVEMADKADGTIVMTLLELSLSW